MRFLPVIVFRSSLGDCTAGGISSTDDYTLVVPCEDGFLSYQDVLEGDYIVLELEHKCNDYVCFKQRNDNRWLMNGGNFAYSSDSRFSRHYGYQPIPIHDRYEG